MSFVSVVGGRNPQRNPRLHKWRTTMTEPRRTFDSRC
jgi:hypothetical protein